MANLKISELTALATQPADDDSLVVVDKSDTTDSAVGTTKKITAVVANPLSTVAVYGRSKLSVAPASASAPIAVGDNDTRVPIQGENDALVGTSGTPSTSNPYATKATTDTLATSASVTSALGFKTYSVGALDNALIKTYFNIQLPFILWTGATNEAATTNFPNWVRTADGGAENVGVAPMGSLANFTGTASESLSLDFWTSLITFDLSGLLIMDWWAILPATSTGDICIGGFGGQSGAFSVGYNSYASTGRVAFYQSAAGILYSHISKETGTSVTNTDIDAGFTPTIWNNFRIELDLGVEARFYINGVLKSTMSGASFLTGAITTFIGFGRSNTAAFKVTAPTLSLQMNP